MLAMTTQLALFEEISTLSAQMVAAARENNWQQLVDLERSVAALRDQLMTEDSNNLLSPDEMELKRALIQRILDDDAEVRRHTEPWMEQVKRFLGGNAKRRQVESAYGAST